MSQTPVPEGMFEIPPGTPPELLTQYAAQFAIEAIVMAIGDREIVPGKSAMSAETIQESLAIAQAMLIAADVQIRTPRAVREAGEHVGTMVAGIARIVREQGDDTAAQLLAMLGLGVHDLPRN